MSTPRTYEMWPARLEGEKVAYLTEGEYGPLMAIVHQFHAACHHGEGVTLDSLHEFARGVALAVKPEVADRDRPDVTGRVARTELLEAARATLPALMLLGDFIGNEFSGKVGIPPFDRCAIILALRDSIAKIEVQP